MSALLEVRDLSVEIPTMAGLVSAVRGVSFAVDKGEVLCIVGESGCGKSLTSLALMGLLPRRARSRAEVLRFSDRDLTSVSRAQFSDLRGDRIAMIFQDPMTSLNPVLTVGFQIEEAIALHQQRTQKQAARQARDMLKMVGIPEERAGDYPHEFSGGMRQRVGIAVALSCNPKLLIADEPTTALDVTIQAQVLDLMRRLRDELGTSMLLITHDLGVVAEVCDSVAIMYAGTVVETADTERLFTNPRHPYTKGLFGSIPSLDEEVDRLMPIKGIMPDPTELPSGCRFHPRCPKAEAICAQRTPVMVEVEPEHHVDCMIYEGLVSDKED